jgi:hypothetical protein
MMVIPTPHHSLKLAREGKGIGNSYTFPYSQFQFPGVRISSKLPRNKANMTRENEASYLEKINESIAKGTSWERITELIQLENSRESKAKSKSTFQIIPFIEISKPSSLPEMKVPPRLASLVLVLGG